MWVGAFGWWAGWSLGGWGRCNVGPACPPHTSPPPLSLPPNHPLLSPPTTTSHTLQLMEVNESPIFLRLDPDADPAGARDQLPVYLYESGKFLGGGR